VAGANNTQSTNLYYLNCIPVRACLLLIFFFFSCALADSRIYAPSKCDTPRTFYVISHGWHTGIAVNKKDLINRVPSLNDDLGDGDYLEVGWGDEQFYQAREITTGLAMRAILLPTATVLHVVDINNEPRYFFPASKIIKLSVPEPGYEKLLTYISDTFLRNSDNNIIKLGTGLYGNSRFYMAKGNFHAFNTCNTWVSKGIASTGFPIKGNAITADDVMSQLENAADMACYQSE